MGFPEIEGYEIRREIGRGASGVVYEAVARDGAVRAIKVFEAISSNPSLFERQLGRVILGEALEVTVPVVALALDARPALVVMPYFGKEGGCPRNLQREEELGGGWEFLGKLAAALRRLHRVRVAHGNLKPGNIFLDEDGGPLLADYACGLMPGVHRYQYSDAVLYAPPEQLRNPDGYLEEEGYRWDVYAFGVLAYRLLFGKFPRADGIFEPVCPPQGSAGDLDIEADYEAIAQSLEASDPVAWPEEGGDAHEQRRREILASCLHLDPVKRPVDMMEVCRRLEVIEEDLAVEQEREELIGERERARRKWRGAKRRFALASLVAIGLGAGWGVTQKLREREAAEAANDFSDYRDETEGTITGLEAEVRRVEKEREEALAGEDQARSLLAAEQEKAREELRSAQRVNDRLFDWVLEEGEEELPVLRGHEERLGDLLAEVDRQLEGLEARPSLADQAAVLRLRGAELALAMGELERGEKRLKEALTAESLAGEQSARARLRLLLLLSKENPEALGDRLAEHEAKIREGFSGDEVGRLRAEAALALVKARMWEARDDAEKALEEALTSLEKFRALDELFPGHPAVRFGMGLKALGAARAAEAIGKREEEARLRAEAAEAFSLLAETLDEPAPEIEYQVASARAGQALAAWQQGGLFEAEQLARTTLTRLQELEKKLPGDFRVTVDRVSQQGILATSLWDGGEVEEARRLLGDGIESLEAGLREHPENGKARYLLASLKWQLSGILGQQGESDGEMSLGTEAREGLEFLLAAKASRPHPTQIRKSLAYLCGDLGHAAEKNGDLGVARAHLESSERYWEDLAKDDPEGREIQEGLRWVRDRLANLGE